MEIVYRVTPEYLADQAIQKQAIDDFEELSVFLYFSPAMRLALKKAKEGEDYEILRLHVHKYEKSKDSLGTVHPADIVYVERAGTTRKPVQK